MNLINAFENGDLCSLIFLAVILNFVAQFVTRDRPDLLIWSSRIAIAGAVAYTGFAIYRDGLDDVQQIIFAALKGLVLCGILFGLSNLFLPTLEFCFRTAIVNWRNRRNATTSARGQRREEREKTEQQERERRECERLRPHREQAAREAQEKRISEAQQHDAAFQRREDARVACEILFSLRESEITNRFSREQFNEFINNYLSDEKSADVVERRAGELQLLIERHHEAVVPPQKFATLSELTKWFEQQKREVESLPISELYKQDYLVRLNERYSELSDRILESL